jgi:hypothetical protein
VDYLKNYEALIERMTGVTLPVSEPPVPPKRSRTKKRD